MNTIFGNDFKIPLNFSLTAEPFKPRPHYNRNVQQAPPQLNPQTTEFCVKLGIDDPLEKLIGKPIVLATPVVNPDEIALEDEDGDEVELERADQATPVEGNDLFFVDTKPQKRGKMNLPQPQNEMPDEAELVAEKVSEPVNVSSNEISTNVQAAEEDVPTVKKFKRRNQELYMNEESST